MFQITLTQLLSLGRSIAQYNDSHLHKYKEIFGGLCIDKYILSLHLHQRSWVFPCPPFTSLVPLFLSSILRSSPSHYLSISLSSHLLSFPAISSSLLFPCIRYCIRLGLIAFSKGRDNGSGSGSEGITLIELIAPVSCSATCNAWADKVGKGFNILWLRESVSSNCTTNHYK